jgi:hypothetical protein
VPPPHPTDMGIMNLISILIGLVTLGFAMVAFVPLLGWLYWFIIPIALLGLGIGSLARGTAGRNLNMVVIVVGVIRLIIGHGIF